MAKNQNQIVLIIVGVIVFLFFVGPQLGLFSAPDMGSMNFPMASDGIIWLDGTPTQGAEISYRLADGSFVTIQEGDGQTLKTDSNGIWSAILLSYCSDSINGKRVYLYVDGENTGHSFLFETFATAPLYIIGDVKTGKAEITFEDELGNKYENIGNCDPRRVKFYYSPDSWHFLETEERIVGTYTVSVEPYDSSSLSSCRIDRGAGWEYSDPPYYSSTSKTFTINDGQTTNVKVIIPLSDLGKEKVSENEPAQIKIWRTAGSSSGTYCKSYYMTEQGFQDLNTDRKWRTREECIAYLDAQEDGISEICGDGICNEGGLGANSCHADCGYCGDGICQYDADHYRENFMFCPQDCDDDYDTTYVEDPGEDGENDEKYEEDKDEFDENVEVVDEDEEDTDNDGYSDDEEEYAGTDPENPNDTPTTTTTPSFDVNKVLFKLGDFEVTTLILILTIVGIFIIFIFKK